MEVRRLGRTGLMVTRTAFGVLPLQRTGMTEAVRILCRAFDAGINFYDTARSYTDSEEKIGAALGGVRDRIVLATKSGALAREGIMADIETSLRLLRTDHVDLFQLHNPSSLPDPADPNSSYAGLLQAQREGKTRFIGITSHSLERAAASVDTGLYDTLQYPLSSISDPRDIAVVDRCRDRDVGFIAMKPLCGGLLTDVPSAFAFFGQHGTAIPIWGIQRMTELEQILALEKHPPSLDAAVLSRIEQDRRELAGSFCRACGYCLPCPADIPIPMAARMGLLLRRMPYRQFLAPEWNEKMNRVRDCTECGHCREHCPYGLDTPALLRKSLVEYESFRAAHAG